MILNKFCTKHIENNISLFSSFTQTETVETSGQTSRRRLLLDQPVDTLFNHPVNLSRPPPICTVIPTQPSTYDPGPEHQVGFGRPPIDRHVHPLLIHPLVPNYPPPFLLPCPPPPSSMHRPNPFYFGNRFSSPKIRVRPNNFLYEQNVSF